MSDIYIPHKTIIVVLKDFIHESIFYLVAPGVFSVHANCTVVVLHDVKYSYKFISTIPTVNVIMRDNV